MQCDVSLQLLGLCLYVVDGGFVMGSQVKKPRAALCSISDRNQVVGAFFFISGHSPARCARESRLWKGRRREFFALFCGGESRAAYVRRVAESFFEQSIRTVEKFVSEVVC